MSSRKPKQDVECSIELETPQLQLIEVVPSRTASPAAPRARWEAKSDLIVEFPSNEPRSRLH